MFGSGTKTNGCTDGRDCSSSPSCRRLGPLHPLSPCGCQIPRRGGLKSTARKSQSENKTVWRVRTGCLDVVEPQCDVVGTRAGDVDGHVLERPARHVSAYNMRQVEMHAHQVTVYVSPEYQVVLLFGYVTGGVQTSRFAAGVGVALDS